MSVSNVKDFIETIKKEENYSMLEKIDEMTADEIVAHAADNGFVFSLDELETIVGEIKKEHFGNYHAEPKTCTFLSAVIRTEGWSCKTGKIDEV
ncbi:Nif11-like leader peptide family natural product precursor [Vibrio harveyi]|uniref:Nif11-like leader peptide family natural product precursor n=1 Tax=Vibrio harveyi TaxID=669 RepID=UPI002380A62D|nr:Nif11-like leader peptide family natural product precursor [Vibrio harveyi]